MNMKKIIITITLSLVVIGLRAQCLPDMQFTVAGIYPDSATGLSNAYVGQLYQQNITIIVPTDTPIVVTAGLPAVTVTNSPLRKP